MAEGESEDDDSCIVMGRYLVKGISSGASLRGEGSFSRVWLATDTKGDSQKVAAKTYKADPEDIEEQKLVMKKFERQISVLQFLQEPLQKGDLDDSLWSA
eukprot:gnl/MRDRNA2_/MRDRNA2_158846_c0_seq1.p1 gnl/MRDRNA2_/MRDRNA2_158846_c0~~gnl/MRDRNA2_/MRDRNA2_158846_c0_seq1.p1  ORF type:complete len:100 (-),score=25.10 gnl/MRDRNA2_/MRDRNA2_158846_c0_seq1:61-360(-)